MDDILPRSHPSYTLQADATVPPTYDENANDTTVPVNYRYDPTKLQQCQLFETHRASNVIHADYNKECLPLPKCAYSFLIYSLLICHLVITRQ